jgi:hypothetical protein
MHLKLEIIFRKQKISTVHFESTFHQKFFSLPEKTNSKKVEPKNV